MKRNESDFQTLQANLNLKERYDATKDVNLMDINIRKLRRNG
jgi:hypothetical protein